MTAAFVMAIAAPLQAREIKMTAQTVREISGSAFTDAIEMLAIIEVLEAGNQKPVIKGVNDAGAGRAGEHIKRALFTRLHFLVARCYGKTRRKDRHARKAFEILKDPKIAAEMQNSADLKDAQSMWEACCNDNRLKAFIHFRDKFLAHLREPDAEVGTPTYGEVFALARATAAALEKLAHATGVVTLTLESQIPAHKESARKFFAPWVKA
jgi:hypothetical protein